jgi:UDP-glucuronate 4-epimerase
MQPGDVISTYADVEDLRRDIGFEPSMDLTEGIDRWIAWYKNYVAY